MSTNKDKFIFSEFATGNISYRHDIRKTDSYWLGVDHTDCYQSVFVFDENLQKYYEKEKSLQAYSGLHTAHYLPLDFDIFAKSGKSLDEVRQECVKIIRLLSDKYAIPIQYLNIFYSGSKGFHVMIPMKVFGNVEPSETFYLIVKDLVKEICAEATCLDYSNYQIIRLFRIPASIHSKSGLYKIPINFEELKTLSIQEIQEMAKKRRELKPIIHESEIVSIETCKVLFDKYVQKHSANVKSEVAVAKYSINEEDVLHSAPITDSNFPNESGDGQIQLEKQYLLLRNSEEGSRTTTLFKVSCECKRIASSHKIDTHLIYNALHKSGLELGIEEKKVHEQIQRGFSYGDKGSLDLLNGSEGIDLFSETSRIDKFYHKYYNNNLGHINMNEFDFTDFDNAKLLEYLHKGHVLFSSLRDKWLVKEGHYWTIEPDFMNNLGANLAILREECWLLAERKSNEHIKTIKTLKNKRRIQDTLALAKSLPGLQDKINAWETKDYYLCVKNGIIDLRTGELLKEVTDDRFINYLDIEYHPEAKAVMYLDFINKCSQNDQEWVLMMQEALGYSITGSTEERLFFFLKGDGTNGKGTLFKILNDILSYYCFGAMESTFDKRNHDSGKTNVKFITTRIVTIGELNVGAKFNEALLKSLVAGDALTARYHYKEEISFFPKVKLWLSANNIIKLIDSNSMRERLCVIPFEYNFKQDLDIHFFEKIKAEREGILAWLVAGAKLWYENGSTMRERFPESWTKATSSFWQTSNPIRDYLLENTINEDIAKTTPEPLFNDYRKWSEIKGYKPYEISSNAVFYEFLNKMYKKNGSRQLLGIRLKTDAEKLNAKLGDLSS